MRRVGNAYKYHRLSRFVQHSTPKRLANYMLVRSEYELGASRLARVSPLVYIDPVNVCNLRCPLCPTGQHVLGRRGGTRPFDLFKELIDEVADRIYFVNLYKWGEPLLHPRIFDMVEHAAAKGLCVRISSNLNRMTSDHARLMVESGLEELLVDIDGAKQDTAHGHE